MEDTTIEDVLKTFEDFYASKDYEKALLTLKTHEEELSPGILHYNLGTVYAQIENLPLARFHLLKAERSGLTSERLQQNLNIVEEKLDMNKLERATSVQDHFVQVSTTLSGDILNSLSLVLLIIGLLILRQKRTVTRMIALILMVSLPLTFDFWVRSWPRAVVLEPQEVREGPSQIFSPVAELPSGVVIIFQDHGDWRKITYPNRFRGWIKPQSIKELE